MVALIELLRRSRGASRSHSDRAAGAIDCEAHEPSVTDAGQVDAIAGDDRRGVSRWEISLPDEIAAPD